MDMSKLTPEQQLMGMQIRVNSMMPGLGMPGSIRIKGASYGDTSGASSSSGYPTPGNVQPGSANPFTWSFPQYSQTWAFTPPAPSAFRMPPAFDPKSPTGYAKAPAAPKPTTALGQVASSSPFSLTDLMAKYR